MTKQTQNYTAEQIKLLKKIDKSWEEIIGKDGQGGLVNYVNDQIQMFSNKGNKTAGTRARKGLQDMKNLFQEIRIAIQDIKNAE